MDGYTSTMMQGQGYASVGQSYVQHTGETASTRITGNQVSTELLTDLKAGDTFQGEIMSVNGQDVQLQLANGQYMAAKLEAQMQLALGQILNFEVQSNQNNRIVLKPLYTNLLQQQVGEAALRAASLPVNQKSLQLVSMMIENGVSIDKNNLPKLYRQIVQNPQAPVSDILYLNKLNIPITEDNLTQYAQYKGMEHQLLGGIEDTSKEILSLYDELADTGADAGAQTVSGQGTSIAVSYMDEVVHFLLRDESEGNAQEQQIVNTEQVGNPSVDSQSGTTNQNTTDTTLNQQANSPVSELTDAEVKKTNASTPEHMGQEITDQEKALENKNTLRTDHKEQPLTFNAETDWKEQLSKWLEETPQSREKIYHSDRFREVLTKALTDKWTLTPEEVGEKQKVEQFYHRLSAESEQLSQLMQESAQNRTAGSSAGNIHENISFMNELNQTFQYVQLPLKMSGKNANGELYVYTNKKNLARKNGTLTALLHLDMANLGPMDIKISLETEKDILTTRFCLEEDVISFMQEHMEELTTRLTRAGYSCKTYVKPRKEQQSVMEVIEEQSGVHVTPLSYQAFDIKA